MRKIGPPSYSQLSPIFHLQHSVPIEAPFLETSTVDIPKRLTLKYTLSLQKSILKIANQRVPIQISEGSLAFGYMLLLLKVKSKLPLVSAAIGENNFAFAQIGKVELSEILYSPTLDAHLMRKTTLPSPLHAYAFPHCHTLAFSPSLSKPPFHTQTRAHYLQPALPMRHLILGPALVEILTWKVDEALLSGGIGKYLIRLSLLKCHTNTLPMSFLLFRRKADQFSCSFILEYLIEFASTNCGGAQSLTSRSHLQQSVINAKLQLI